MGTPQDPHANCPRHSKVLGICRLLVKTVHENTDDSVVLSCDDLHVCCHATGAKWGNLDTGAHDNTTFLPQTIFWVALKTWAFHHVPPFTQNISGMLIFCALMFLFFWLKIKNSKPSSRNGSHCLYPASSHQKSGVAVLTKKSGVDSVNV